MFSFFNFGYFLFWVCLFNCFEFTPTHSVNHGFNLPLSSHDIGCRAEDRALRIGIHTCFSSAEGTSSTTSGSSLADSNIFEIAQAHGGSTMRTAAHQVSNHFSTDGFLLVFKDYYLRAGITSLLAKPTINPGYKEALSFKKEDTTARGTVGVYVYTVLSQCGEKADVAIMWSVPYDYIFYENWFAIKIDKTLKPNYELYEELYYDNQAHYGFVRQKASNGTAEFTFLGITVRASMTDGGQSAIKVEIGPQGFLTSENIIF